MRILFVAAMLTVAMPAAAQNVLVIPDEDNSGTATLINALTNGGLKVTNANVPSFQYQGNPSPVGYDVVVLLAGGPGPNSANIDMPPNGQAAIASFVQNGGGLINTEWAAFQVAAGRWQQLKKLVLLTRTGGTTGFIDYDVAPQFVNHPLWAGLPSKFQFATATNVGVVNNQNGGVRVATSMLAGDAVAIRDQPNVGRIVELSTAGNYAPGTFTAPNLQALIINSCKWASLTRVSHPPTANAGGPYMVSVGGSVTLSGSCNDIDGDPTTIAWDFANAGNFADAMGANPIFSAQGLSGPQTLTIAIRCATLAGKSGTATTTLTINPVGPKFSSVPVTAALEASQYVYTATASEPDPKDKLTFALVAGPMGMLVDPISGAVTWTPSFDQARTGSAKVQLSVTDVNNLSDMQPFAITVNWIDSDMDGLPDTWEKMYFHNICNMQGKNDLCEGPGDDPDKDGRPNLKEFQDGTDPTQYDGPSAPSVVAPDMNLRVMANPALTVTNAIEPHGEALTYEFALYTDAQLTTLFDLTLGVPEGMGGKTAFTVKANLTNDTHYWWRCRARDPYIHGAWSQPGSFFFNSVHSAPTAPTISSPSDTAKVKFSNPTLVVNNAHSPDELKLTYEFEVYADKNLTQKVESMAGVVEGQMGETSYFVATKLAAYAQYWWRVRATDEQLLSGPWSVVPSFEVFPNTPAPSAPAFQAPMNGARLPTRSPTLIVGGSVALDMEPVTYQCDVDSVNTFDSPAKQSVMGLVPDPMTRASWTPPTPLTENQVYWARCRAHTPSASSSWTLLHFLVDVTNDPPSVPTLTNPSMGGMAAGPVVMFTWINAIDPEGDAIHYEVEVFSDQGLTQSAGMAMSSDGTVGVTIGGLTNGSYFWHARAVDALGAASDFSPPNQFTVSSYTVPDGIAHGPAACGCHVGDAPRSHAPLVAGLLGLVVAALLRRRRR